jgi:hypothetical protein
VRGDTASQSQSLTFHARTVSLKDLYSRLDG